MATNPPKKGKGRKAETVATDEAWVMPEAWVSGGVTIAEQAGDVPWALLDSCTMKQNVPDPVEDAWTRNS
jgi:hypothetical protein